MCGNCISMRACVAFVLCWALHSSTRVGIWYVCRCIDCTYSQFFQLQCVRLRHCDHVAALHVGLSADALYIISNRPVNLIDSFPPQCQTFISVLLWLYNIIYSFYKCIYCTRTNYSFRCKHKIHYYDAAAAATALMHKS